MSAKVVQDDKRALFFVCETCMSGKGQKCTEPTDFGRKSVAYIHTRRIESLRKALEANKSNPWETEEWRDAHETLSETERARYEGEEMR